MDYYEELGVSPNATEAEIRQMYRRTVKLFHPDQYQDPQMKAIAGRQMIRLNDILHTLTVPERRHRYDLSLLQLLRPVPLLPKSGVRQRMATRVEWHMQRLDDALRFTRKPLAAAIFAACILGILGGVALANMRDSDDAAPVQPSAIVQPEDAGAPATGPVTVSPKQPEAAAAVSKPHRRMHNRAKQQMQSTIAPDVDQIPSY